MDEQWKGIPGFPLHEVSTFGRVLTSRHGKEHILSLVWYKREGQYAITIGHENRRHTFRIMRLVLSVFRPIEDMNLYHAVPKDGDATNTRLDNLEWRSRLGSGSPVAKITEDDVREIRRLYMQDKTQTHASIAKKFNLGESTVGHIMAGLTWWHVEETGLA